MDCRIPFEQIQPRHQPANPMNENAEVETRFPRHRIPGRHSGARQQPVQHPVEGVGGDRSLPVQSEATAALADQRGRRHLARRCQWRQCSGLKSLARCRFRLPGRLRHLVDNRPIDMLWTQRIGRTLPRSGRPATQSERRGEALTPESFLTAQSGARMRSIRLTFRRICYT